MKKKLVTILGANGQVGSECVRQFGKEFTLNSVTAKMLDNYNTKTITNYLKNLRADIIVNCVSLTNLTQCESNTALANDLNSTLPFAIAKCCPGATIVQLSTDYVFNGMKRTPYTEKDSTYPLNYYGLSKSMGELNLQTHTDKYYIVRTSSLFTSKVSFYGKPNFVFSIIKKLKDGETLKFNDTLTMTPTSTTELVRNIGVIMKQEPDYGIYHCTQEGEATWFDYVQQIADTFHLDKNQIFPIKSYPDSFKRPEYTVLDNTKIRGIEGIRIDDWRNAFNWEFSKYYEGL